MRGPRENTTRQGPRDACMGPSNFTRRQDPQTSSTAGPSELEMDVKTDISQLDPRIMQLARLFDSDGGATVNMTVASQIKARYLDRASRHVLKNCVVKSSWNNQETIMGFKVINSTLCIILPLVFFVTLTNEYSVRHESIRRQGLFYVK